MTIYRLLFFSLLALVYSSNPSHAELGRDWQRLPNVPFDTNCLKIGFGNRIYAFPTSGTQVAVWSTSDGLAWQGDRTNLQGQLITLTAHNGKLWTFVLEQNDCHLYSSLNGTAWTMHAGATLTSASLTPPEGGTWPTLVSTGPAMRTYLGNRALELTSVTTWRELKTVIDFDYATVPLSFKGSFFRYYYIPSYLRGSADGLTFDKNIVLPFESRLLPPVATSDTLLALPNYFPGTVFDPRVWISSDGADWHAAGDSPFPTESLNVGTPAAGKLWVIGSMDTRTSTHNRQLWISAASNSPVRCTPGVVRFGQVMPAEIPRILTIALFNGTTQTLHISRANTRGFDVPFFKLERADVFSPLPPQTTRTLEVSFHSWIPGYYSTNFEIVTDFAGGTTCTVPLFGETVADAPRLQISPSALDFGPNAGLTAPLAFKIQNTGTQPLTLNQVSIDEPDPWLFHIQHVTTGTLNPGQASVCTLDFNATHAQGHATATLRANSTAGDASANITGMAWAACANYWERIAKPLQFSTYAFYKSRFYATNSDGLYTSSNFSDWSALPVNISMAGVVAATAGAGKLWLLGNSLWNSVDGQVWTTHTLPSATRSSLPVVFNNQLWLLGGTESGAVSREVWRTTDGLAWQPLPSGPPAIESYCAAAAGNGALLVCVNEGVLHHPHYRLYRTADGNAWQPCPDVLAGSQYFPPAITFARGMFWMMDVTTGNGLLRSTNGSQWERISDNIGVLFPASPFYLGCNGESLFIAGGTYSGSAALLDAWKTPFPANCAHDWQLLE